MDTAFVWDIDPTIIKLGPLQLRYYGIIFATVLLLGFYIWNKQMVRGGYSRQLSEKFLLWGVVAVIAGARLGHCLFYEPERYLSNPVQILFIWKGGLASHGATVGLALALILFAKKYKIPVFEALDRFSMPSAIGAASVRLGNFFNSEIVGRPTDVPWAVRFPRHDCHTLQMCDAAVPRHPSQLYEFFFGLAVLLALYLADIVFGREKRPRGLIAGLFLSLYFGGRFLVEYVKDYQTDLASSQGLTMGQYLSIVPFAAGLIVIAWAFLHTDNKITAPVVQEPSTDIAVKTRSKKSKKHKRKK